MKGHKAMIKIIALIGKSGAGKDTLLKRVLAKHPEYNNLISYTTRPPRSNEVHGRDYYFIDVPTFEEMTLSGMMLEAQAFNGWFYGKGIANLSKTKINIGIFSPAGIESLLMYDDIDLNTKSELQPCEGSEIEIHSNFCSVIGNIHDNRELLEK